MSGDQKPEGLAEMLDRREAWLLKCATNVHEHLKNMLKPPAEYPDGGTPEEKFNWRFVDWAGNVVQEIKSTFAMIRSMTGTAPGEADQPAVIDAE